MALNAEIDGAVIPISVDPYRRAKLSY
jgi:hypothetical protein